ncbi:hypothetical protein [Streptomyces sp. BE303]|uniref:hypothetical protein n=1 Tax=Streptomyces sp. BE303 TaxID=3002528 RepID=UPI002E7752CA|nr:hypothetical protein [Streptomyces sp. BE303]MED7951484.1 hypothetical protein [Streptomyces sp. BE303]
MKRTALVLATALALAGPPAAAVAAPATATTPSVGASAPTAAGQASGTAAGPAAVTSGCGPAVMMINRLNSVCVTVDGTSVSVYGSSAQLIPGPGRSFLYTVSLAVVGGAGLGTRSGSTYLGAGTGYVSGPKAEAPCGSTVRASFSLTDFGTPPPASTVDVPVTC